MTRWICLAFVRRIACVASETLYGASFNRNAKRRSQRERREKIKTPVIIGEELFSVKAERSRHCDSVRLFLFFFFFPEAALGQRFLNEDESCWWGVGGRARGCSVVWMLMNWCSNLLMRSKLSPLSGFVHMKGHLPRRGHCDSSLTVSKPVSRCVVAYVCVCVRM